MTALRVILEAARLLARLLPVALLVAALAWLNGGNRK